MKWYTSLSIYVDDANILSGNVHTVKKNTEALVFASKEIGLEVNADETKVRGHVSRSESRTESKFYSVRN